MSQTETTTNRDITETRSQALTNPFDDMERFFNQFVPRSWFGNLRRDWPDFGELASSMDIRVPHVDVIDDAESVVIKAEIPGIAKKDLDIEVSDNAVTIKGETRREKQTKKRGYLQNEIRQGSFLRNIPLPCAVDADKARAVYNDGVLQLTLPKSTNQGRRRVTVD